MHKPAELLLALGCDGSRNAITAPVIHGPVSISFNNGYLGPPAAGETTWVTGHWVAMQEVRVGPPDSRSRELVFLTP